LYFHNLIYLRFPFFRNFIDKCSSFDILYRLSWLPLSYSGYFFINHTSCNCNTLHWIYWLSV